MERLLIICAAFVTLTYIKHKLNVLRKRNVQKNKEKKKLRKIEENRKKYQINGIKHVL